MAALMKPRAARKTAGKPAAVCFIPAAECDQQLFLYVDHVSVSTNVHGFTAERHSHSNKIVDHRVYGRRR